MKNELSKIFLAEPKITALFPLFLLKTSECASFFVSLPMAFGLGKSSTGTWSDARLQCRTHRAVVHSVL